MRAFNETSADAPPSADSGSAALTRDALRHARKNSNSPYDVAAVYTGQQLVGNNPNYLPNDGAPKSPQKSALAEAWGRADPEPFEEFSAGGYVAGQNTATTDSYPYPQYGDMEGAMSGVATNANNGRDQDLSTSEIVVE